MKKILIYLIFLLFNSMAYADSISGVVFFGDSLSDNGNLYKYLFGFMPKSPPYFGGRFTNGETWNEYVGQYYQQKYNVPFQNYAVGGATATFHWPTPKFVAPSILGLEVDEYLLGSLFKNRSDVLFTIWIGGNDYLFDANVNPDTATTNVVTHIVKSINTLIYYGGKHFVILNLPDLSFIPFAKWMPEKDKLKVLTQLHNQKLNAAMERLRALHPDIKITYIDIYGLFNDVITHPEKYNEKYHVHIKNGTEACWGGGYILRKENPAALTQQIRQNLLEKGIRQTDLDIDNVSALIRSSPALASAYAVGRSYDLGFKPCVAPDEYFFWDEVHPTQVVHRILALIILEELAKAV